MTKALIVCFYRYTPRTSDHYKTQGELFLKYAKSWYPHIDAMYIADAGWGFDDKDLHPNTTKITEDYRSHWWYMNELFKLVKEDTFLLIDPDMFIYDTEVVKNGFKQLESYSMAGILDNSGSKDLFPANEYRDVRRRFTPYMTFGHTVDFRDKDFTPTQKDGQFEFDSMGEITFNLYDKVSLYEMRDDRFSVYLNEDGTIDTSMNLDAPTFIWSKDREDLGYYHVRNSSIGLSLMDEFISDKEAYKRRKSITPFQEMMRLLMWQWQCDKQTGKLNDYKNMFKNVLDDYGVSEENWVKYSDAFEQAHNWLSR